MSWLSHPRLSSVDIADIFWAADESVQANKAVLEQLEVLNSTVFEAAVMRSLNGKINHFCHLAVREWVAEIPTTQRKIIWAW